MRLGEIVWPEGEINRINKALTNGHTVYTPYAEHFAALWRDFQECPRFPRPGCTPDGVMSSWFALHGLGAFVPGHMGGREIITGGGREGREAVKRVRM